MLSITKAVYLEDYKIQLTFNNGLVGVANLKELINTEKRKVFACLKDKNVFKNFQLNFGTIVWFSELDLAPEYLFYLVFKNQDEFQMQFKTWGYIN
ncbi:MAG: DUF2442 domain-containing protein [Methylococcaceae bacterium]